MPRNFTKVTSTPISASVQIWAQKLRIDRSCV